MSRHVGDVVPWVTIQWLLKPVLVEEMADETDAPTQDEQSIDGSHLDVLFRFLTENGFELITLSWDRMEIVNNTNSVNWPVCLKRSTKAAAMSPSTLRMRLGFFFVVMDSTFKA